MLVHERQGVHRSVLDNVGHDVRMMERMPRQREAQKAPAARAPGLEGWRALEGWRGEAPLAAETRLEVHDLRRLARAGAGGDLGPRRC